MLLLHTEAMLLARVYELWEELKGFLTNEKYDDAKLLASKEWCARAACRLGFFF